MTFNFFLSAKLKIPRWPATSNTLQMNSTLSNTLLLIGAAAATATMDDFNTRVRAEALRRLDVQRFEAAVETEMIRISHERELAKQPALYRELHQKRKMELATMYEKGDLPSSVFTIEAALSDLVIGNLDEEAFYIKVSTIQPTYIYAYEREVGRIPVPKSYTPPTPRPEIPREFQIYVDMACGKMFEGPLIAQRLFQQFNEISAVRIRM